jgi:hypothetical protein
MLRKALFLFLSLIMALIINCKEDTPVQPSDMPANGALEMVYPIGGEKLYVEDTVTLTFKINPPTVGGGATPWVSIDNGKTWAEIIGISITPTGVNPQKLYHKWIIGKESTKVDYKDTNTQCMVKVTKYGETSVFHASGVFTITK